MCTDNGGIFQKTGGWTPGAKMEGISPKRLFQSRDPFTDDQFLGYWRETRMWGVSWVSETQNIFWKEGSISWDT